MNEFLTMVANGISIGMMYALVSMGFVVIFRGTRVLNFAQGSFLVLGVYLTAELQPHIGFGAAVAVGIVSTAALGILVNRFLLRPLRRAPSDIPAIVMIGANIIMIAELTRRIGTDVLSVGDPFGNDNVHVGGILIGEARLAGFLVSVVLVVGLFALNKYTSVGLASRAAAEDREMAALVGARLARVSDLAWLLGGALAAVAGLFVVMYPSAGLVSDTSTVAILAFPAAVIGGLDSLPGALVGGILVGLTQTISAGYQSDLLFLGRGISEVLPWVLMLVVVLMRPTGLFGKQPLYRI